MKKIILFLATITVASISSAAITSTSCSGASSCDSCFRETQKLYTCNPYQSSCQKDTAINLSDSVTNISGGDKVMYQFDMGKINFTRLQSTTDWSMSHATIPDMFEITQAYLTPASSAGAK